MPRAVAALRHSRKLLTDIEGQLGSLLVTAWLGAFFVAYYSLNAPLTTAAVKRLIEDYP